MTPRERAMLYFVYFECFVLSVSKTKVPLENLNKFNLVFWAVNFILSTGWLLRVGWLWLKE